jgi:hypothetical protein
VFLAVGVIEKLFVEDIVGEGDGLVDGRVGFDQVEAFGEEDFQERFRLWDR